MLARWSERRDPELTLRSFGKDYITRLVRERCTHSLFMDAGEWYAAHSCCLRWPHPASWVVVGREKDQALVRPLVEFLDMLLTDESIVHAADRRVDS